MFPVQSVRNINAESWACGDKYSMKPITALIFGLTLCLAPSALTANSHHAPTHKSKTSAHVQDPASVQKHLSSKQHSTRPASTKTVHSTHSSAKHGHVQYASLSVHHRRSYERFTGNSFADNVSNGDQILGEDPVVRAAAVDALGNMNGTVVAIDPNTGRILAMVNQNLALSSGAEPCSTIKVSVALAALQEGIITKDTPVNLGGAYHLNLTEALAHSNNLYFETLGRTLGF